MDRIYLDLNYIGTFFNHIEDFIFSTELVADLLDAFEGYPLLGLSVFGLKDVTLVREEVPKQPEPMILSML